MIYYIYQMYCSHSSRNGVDTQVKLKFPLTVSSVNVTKSYGNCGFGHIY